MKQRVATIFFTALMSLYCCEENQKNLNHLVDWQDPIKQARMLLMTPDSLRTTEDKELIMKIECLIYEGCSLENGKLEMHISKSAWKRSAIPEIYYNMLKQEVGDINRWLDTVSHPFPDLFEASWCEARDEYFARKTSPQ